MYNILCGKTSGPSCRLIRDYIEEKTGVRYLLQRGKNLSVDVLFRYGNAMRVSGQDTEHNKRSSILLLGDKYKFSKIMKEKEIPSPIYYREDSVPENYPVLIRKTMTGFGGSGIYVCKTEDEFLTDWDYGDFWTPFIKTKFEVRAHCMGGKVVRIFKKVKVDGEPESEFPIRHNSLYKFSLRGNEHYPRLIEFLEEKVLPVLDISFCGIDVGIVEGGFFVFEGNTAPGVSKITAQKYGDYLIDVLGLERI